MTTERETLDAHYGEIGRAADGTLPGCSYSREVVFDVEQDPDLDYLGALTCVEDVLTDNMLEIPVDKVISGSGSPATNYPRAAIASAVPPTPHYYIQMAMFANQGSSDSYLGMYARYTAIPSGSPEIGDAQYYLLKIFPYVSSEGGSVFQLVRGSYGGSTTIIATEVHPAFFGYAKFRWDISGGSHRVRDMLGAVLGTRVPVLTANDYVLQSAGSVGLVVMDGTLTGRDIKIDEVKAAAIPFTGDRPFFLDYFDGVAVVGIDGRVPDIGNNWGDVSAWPADIVANGLSPGSPVTSDLATRFAITGAGEMAPPSNADSSYTLPFPYTLPVPPWYFEWRFRFTSALAPSQFGEVLNMDLFAYNPDGTENTFNDFQLQYYENYSGGMVPDPAFEIGWSGPWTQSPSGIPFLTAVVSPLPTSLSEYVLRIEMRRDHQCSVLLNGTEIANITGSAGFTTNAEWNAFRWALWSFDGGAYFGNTDQTYSGAANAPMVITKVEMGVLSR